MLLAQGSLEPLDDPSAVRSLVSTAFARLRGRAELGPPGGIVVEYAAAHRRGYGEQQSRTTIQQMRSVGLRMVCIAVRPTWASALDFWTRVPGGMS